MDIYESKTIRPMLIGADSEPFDSSDYIFELKLDGERCIAYLDPKGEVELRNKRNVRMLPKVPELRELHMYVDRKCILDGELIILKNGVPDFSAIKSRSLMSNTFKIELSSKKQPATFVAFDILYCESRQIVDRPLTERKEMLKSCVVREDSKLALSRCFDCGKALYSIAEERDLEGTVAKRKDSRYYFDKRTSDWIKIKNLKDDDFVVCGYIMKEGGVVSIIIAQYRGSVLCYKGHVTLGISRSDFAAISAHTPLDEPPLDYPRTKDNERAVWIDPDLVCTVKYMQKTPNGGLRHPVFKGLRLDKSAEECLEH